MVVAAAEVVVGLAIIMTIFRPGARPRSTTPTCSSTRGGPLGATTSLLAAADAAATAARPRSAPVSVLSRRCAWLLIALPLAGAASCCSAAGAPTGGATWLGVAHVGARFVLGARAVLRAARRDPDDRAVEPHLFTWIPVGGLNIDFGLLIDPLSMCFVLLITGVGSLIHIYSIGYMAHDPDRRRFFALPEPVRRGDAAARARRQLPRAVRRLGGRRPRVVPADRVLVLQARPTRTAAKKAFIVNRVGDVGLSIAIMLMFAHARHGRFSGVFDGVERRSAGHR